MLLEKLTAPAFTYTLVTKRLLGEVKHSWPNTTPRVLSRSLAPIRAVSGRCPPVLADSREDFLWVASDQSRGSLCGLDSGRTRAEEPGVY